MPVNTAASFIHHRMAASPVRRAATPLVRPELKEQVELIASLEKAGVEILVDDSIFFGPSKRPLEETAEKLKEFDGRWSSFSLHLQREGERSMKVDSTYTISRLEKAFRKRGHAIKALIEAGCTTCRPNGESAGLLSALSTENYCWSTPQGLIHGSANEVNVAFQLGLLPALEDMELYRAIEAVEKDGKILSRRGNRPEGVDPKIWTYQRARQQVVFAGPLAGAGRVYPAAKNEAEMRTLWGDYTAEAERLRLFDPNFREGEPIRDYLVRLDGFGYFESKSWMDRQSGLHELGEFLKQDKSLVEPRKSLQKIARLGYSKEFTEELFWLLALPHDSLSFDQRLKACQTTLQLDSKNWREIYRAVLSIDEADKVFPTLERLAPSVHDVGLETKGLGRRLLDAASYAQKRGVKVGPFLERCFKEAVVGRRWVPPEEFDRLADEISFEEPGWLTVGGHALQMEE